jgi:hypothetical protein
MEQCLNASLSTGTRPCQEDVWWIAVAAKTFFYSERDELQASPALTQAEDPSLSII